MIKRFSKLMYAGLGEGKLAEAYLEKDGKRIRSMGLTIIIWQLLIQTRAVVIALMTTVSHII